MEKTNLEMTCAEILSVNLARHDLPELPEQLPMGLPEFDPIYPGKID